MGDDIRDEFYDHALFGDVASSPSYMAASTACDAWGALPGHATQLSDADSAYTQSKLGGDPCYVRIPDDWRPAS